MRDVMRIIKKSVRLDATMLPDLRHHVSFAVRHSFLRNRHLFCSVMIPSTLEAAANMPPGAQDVPEVC